MSAALTDSWQSLLRAAGARDETAIRRIGADLLQRWSEPHRRYHDLEHLRAVLDAIDLLAHDDPSIPRDQLDQARLAAWFHDAVHDGIAGADERASARLALDALVELGVTVVAAQRIAELVLVTTDHDPTTARAELRRAAAVLCDADLAVLGGTDVAYDRYAAAVRAEYAHVDDVDFTRGRAQILTDLARSPRLFTTEAGHRRWEGAARSHLAREIARLSPPDRT